MPAPRHPALFNAVFLASLAAPRYWRKNPRRATH